MLFILRKNNMGTKYAGLLNKNDRKSFSMQVLII